MVRPESSWPIIDARMDYFVRRDGSGLSLKI